MGDGVPLIQRHVDQVWNTGLSVQDQLWTSSGRPTRTKLGHQTTGESSGSGSGDYSHSDGEVQTDHGPSTEVTQRSTSQVQPTKKVEGVWNTTRTRLELHLDETCTASGPDLNETRTGPEEDLHQGGNRSELDLVQSRTR